MIYSIIFCLASLVASIASESCSCGVANRGNKRIVGGVKTEKNEYPWQVGLIHTSRGSQPWCGGSLISSETVLTAAHCTAGKKPEDISVLVGEHDTKVEDGEEKIGVVKIIDHPKYSGRATTGPQYDNDFSLLILSKPVTWSKKARQICLPEGEPSSYEKIMATVSGWGKLSSMGRQASTLQEVTVKTMTNEECTGSTTRYKSSRITKNMICAGYSENDSCQGDSGGPLIAREKGGYYSQIGVVSWGDKCSDARAPGVYARVTQQLPWIVANRKGNTCQIPDPESSVLRCSGQENGCCTSETPCSEGEGDCDSNSDCRGSLVCGHNNCPKKAFDWNYGDDCCFSWEDKPGPDQCERTQDCGEGHGDCDGDDDCKGDLVCGGSCQWPDENPFNKDDCCKVKTQKSNSKSKPWWKKFFGLTEEK